MVPRSNPLLPHIRIITIPSGKSFAELYHKIFYKTELETPSFSGYTNTRIIQLTLSTGATQVQTLLAVFWRFAMVRISDNGPTYKTKHFRWSSILSAKIIHPHHNHHHYHHQQKVYSLIKRLLGNYLYWLNLF